MTKEELLKLEDDLNRKYSFILEKLEADIVIEENNTFEKEFYLDFAKRCRLHFPSQEDLEKLLLFNTNNFNLFN